jgi:hypothetical protein
LLDENKVIPLNIKMNFDVIENHFCKKIRRGLKFILGHYPPFLIHCEAGIDRTGFFTILLGTFMDAKIDEIAKDYMLSFVSDDMYSENDRKNGIAFIYGLFSKISDRLVNAGDDLQNIISDYLLKKVRLNSNELLELRNKLIGSNK